MGERQMKKDALMGSGLRSRLGLITSCELNDHHSCLVKEKARGTELDRIEYLNIFSEYLVQIFHHMIGQYNGKMYLDTLLCPALPLKYWRK